MIRLDTHVVVWLFTGETERFSRTATDLLERETLCVSPLVQLELTFLREIGRLTVAGSDIISDLQARIGLELSSVDLAAVVRAAAPLTWTRDPFDRMIAGDALAAGTPLVTRDQTLLEHLPVATW